MYKIKLTCFNLFQPRQKAEIIPFIINDPRSNSINKLLFEVLIELQGIIFPQRKNIRFFPRYDLNKSFIFQIQSRYFKEEFIMNFSFSFSRLFHSHCNEVPGSSSHTPGVSVLQTNVPVPRAACGSRVQFLQGLSVRSSLRLCHQER